MLEDMISGQALARRAAGHTAQGEPMGAAEVFEAGPEVPGLDRLLTDFVTELAFHVVNLAVAINPVRIAVGGGMVRSWDRLRPGLQDALMAGVPFPPELVAARFPSDAPLIGAVGLAVDAARLGGVHGGRVTLPAVSLSEGLTL
jgi:glucokinase